MIHCIRAGRAVTLSRAFVLVGCRTEAQQAPSDSLAPNPNFERGADDQPADESFYSWSQSHGWWDTQHAHRSRCAPGVQPSIRVTGDTVELDARRYISHLIFMRDELGARRFDIPSLWIGHRGDHVMPRDARWQGIEIFADDALTRLRPEFERPFRDYMGKLVAALKDAGVFLEPTVRFIDEPRLNDEPTRNGIRALSELLLDIEPELRIAHTVSAPHPDLLGVTHLGILHTDAWGRSLKQIEMARADRDVILVYNNAVNFPDHRPIRVRLWP